MFNQEISMEDIGMFMKDRCSEFDKIDYLAYRQGISFEQAIRRYAIQNHKSPAWIMRVQDLFTSAYEFCRQPRWYSDDYRHLASTKRLINKIAAPLSSFYTLPNDP